MNENTIKQILVTNINLYLYNLNLCNYFIVLSKPVSLQEISNLSYYREGKDSVDGQREQRKNTVIASVTFGATRPFQLKHVSRADLKRVDIPLANGSLLLMQSATQENWKHKIPKTLKQISPRINLTFRWVG
ncbi:2-oxoglutarate-Fe(II)-dependent oxygenase superfamily protein [Maribacter caenipelagi]|uniref:2-oxoglutarate-Fe(II)-dependent oxygenase superfamily protein n=1 Tax=Maribacter caenipelagi TaxID=1447781 RepID=A0A4R7D7Z1_9FLAO|nr:2-oxoglutarate-Fe(II)-dependent oxygenase superfamily protein [Maribacter caenipelagi]